MRSLGIDRDGPVIRQSERLDSYADAIARLQALGRPYPPCFCTRAEVREAASAPHDELPEGAYPEACRTLTRAQRAARAAEGRPFALRLDAGAERIACEDRLLGPCSGVVQTSWSGAPTACPPISWR